MTKIIDELAAAAGVGDRIIEIIERAMNGELDYGEALRERVGLLKGLSIERVRHACESLPLMPDAREPGDAAKRDPLPEDFDSLEEFWTFWDTHSTTDYEDSMEDADVCVDIHSSMVYCVVAKDLLAQLRTHACQLRRY